jgi:hypothetical protein
MNIAYNLLAISPENSYYSTYFLVTYFLVTYFLVIHKKVIPLKKLIYEDALFLW